MKISAPKATADTDFTRLSGPDFGTAVVKSFEQKRLEEENSHLRSLVEKLSNKLKFKNEEGEFELPMDDKSLKDQLSSHVLGPLMQSYEQTIAQLQRKLEQTKFKLTQQLSDCEEVLIENTRLREQLEIQKR